jgi:DNA-binding NtrC family response regulator
MLGRYGLNDDEFRATSLIQGYDPSGKILKKEYARSLYGNSPGNGDIQTTVGEAVLFESCKVDLGMVGESPAFRKMTKTLRGILRDGNGTVHDVPPVILVTGETGTGKDMVAKVFYVAGPRSKNPFAFLDFGAIMQNPQLFQAQVYGSRRGAYTDAVFQKGILEEANGGVVHMDEIGALIGNDTFQKGLLELLDGKPIYPVGSNKPLSLDLRVIASTNADLDGAVREGRFRADLYQRLDQLRIRVPPLRERREDIPLFVGYYLRLFNEAYGKNFHFDNESPEMKKLVEYDWPGNMRQLQNAIRKSVLTSELAMPQQYETPNSAASRRDAIEWEVKKMMQSGLIVDWDGAMRVGEVARKTFLTIVLEKNRWDINRTAQEIKMDRRTLERMMREYGPGTPDS